MSDITQQIAEFLEQLIEHRRLPLSQWPDAVGSPESYGLTSSGGFILLGADVEVLEESAVRANLSATAADWVRKLDVHRALDSTNLYLMNRAGQGTIDGWICLADVQTQGRGRRGRSWASPFAQNLALSLGIAVHHIQIANKPAMPPSKANTAASGATTGTKSLASQIKATMTTPGHRRSDCRIRLLVCVAFMIQALFRWDGYSRAALTLALSLGGRVQVFQKPFEALRKLSSLWRSRPRHTGRSFSSPAMEVSTGR